MFVDDSIYADVYNDTRARLEQAVAAGIEAIFILLGRSDLTKRQDPVSFDKMEDMMVSHLNKVLGQIIDTRLLDVGVPRSYIGDYLRLLKPFHSQQKTFAVKEMEVLTGMLIHISSTTPWLKFLLAQVYVSVAAAIGDNKTHLSRTNRQFRIFLRESRDPTTIPKTRTYAQSQTATAIHSSPRKHFINKTLQEELRLIMTVLSSKTTKFRTPLAHIVRRNPSAHAWSDSSLRAAGGYSTTIQFWWYID